MKNLNQRQLEKFLTYYHWEEKPNSRVLELFQEIKKRNLYENISLLCEDEMVLQPNMILIQNNGIMIWNGMNPHLDIIEEAISFITKQEQVCICLQTKENTNEQETLRQYMMQGATVGQYAMKIKKIERMLEKKKKAYQIWNDDFEKIKERKTNHVLDRYNEQKVLFQMFGDKKYKKRMEKWETIFSAIRNDSCLL